MLGDKTAFFAAVKKETNRDALSAWEADRKTEESILSRSGLLCATADGLVFV